DDTFTLSGGGTLSGSVAGGGGLGTDRLVGNNSATAWGITGAGSGTQTDVAGGFSGLERLTGGTDNDTFTFGAAGSLTGLIDGGAHLPAGDTADYSALGAGATVTIGTNVINVENLTGGGGTLAGGSVWVIGAGVDNQVDDGTVDGANFINWVNLTGTAGNDTFTFSGGTLSGNIDGLGNTAVGDTLTGDNVANAWTIDGANTGTVTGVGGTYSGIENLTGGTNDDTFTFTVPTASLTGLIDGAAHVAQDTVDYSGLTPPQTITIGTGVMNVEQLTGGDSGATTGFTLAGGSNWNVTGANDGTVDGYTFTNWGNLTGTAADNTFTINGGTLTGAINGVGDGTDSDTLIGDNLVNTWSITGSNQGTLQFPVAQSIAFSNIENLTGGTNDDTFGFNPGGIMSGTINGLGQNVADTLDYSALAGATVAIGADAINVENYVGNNAGFTLAGGSVWDITGPNDGTVDGTITFTDWANLTGTAGADTFTLNGGTLTGNIDGLGGADTLTADNVANTWNVNAPGGGTVTGVGGTFAGIEALTGNANTDAFTFTDAGSITGSLNGAGGTNTLTGDDDGNAFVVTAGNTGTLAVKIGGTWSNIASLTGGAGDDTFALTGGTLSGSLAGGGGTDTLTADNVANTWNINAAGGGTVTGITGTFAGIENLTGGTGTDDFSFDDSGSVAGNVDGGGGAGANTLTGDADGNAFGITGANAGTLIGKVGGTWWNIGTLTGGAGADSFIFDNLGTLSGSLNGAAGTDTLNVSAIAPAPAVNFTGSGVDGFSGTANPPITGGFTNIDAITGGSVTVSIGPGDDTYNYNANTGALAIGASILATASLNSLTINSGAGDDRLTVDASAGDTALQNITNGFTFNGGGQVTSDMLAVIGDANNDTAVYTPDAVTQGNGTISLNAKTITFTGLEPVDITGMA
ncbi:MAG: hypothetical protein GW802_37575, partial [Armatimonadetes bacterium]|nr:hypothetical protein [Armatimonadota bacterium]